MAEDVNGHSAAAAEPVRVSLSELEKGTVPLASLEAAFGPSSLGIIIVSDLPAEYASLRHRLLSYSSRLANLPKDELDKLEKPQAKYLTGWSLGKETLRSGRFDTLKGSYYINCAFHLDASLDGDPSAARYPGFPEYTAPNVWPADAALPGFRAAAQDLCGLVIDVAALVARACDRFGEARVEGYEEGGCLERVVRGSTTTKARLLHYFPSSSSSSQPSTADAQTEGDADDEDDWCATHVDHGCLTGLTSAMYVDEAGCDFSSPLAGEESQSQPQSQPPPPLPELHAPPDPSAGLYVHARTGERAHVRIPRDCLAFQTGKALELMTRGQFKAVPHFVRGVSSSSVKEGERVARNTLAVFTQPNLWEVVDLDSGLDFAAFSKRVVESTY